MVIRASADSQRISTPDFLASILEGAAETTQVRQLQDTDFLSSDAVTSSVPIAIPQESHSRISTTFHSKVNPSPNETRKAQITDLENPAADVLLRNGISSFQNGDFAAATVFFEQGLRNILGPLENRASDETNALLCYFSGAVFEREAQIDRAIALLKQGLTFEKATEGTLAVLHGYLGELHCQKNEYDLAKSAYQTALEINRASDELQAQWSLKLGMIYKMKGSSADAIQRFGRGLTQFNDASSETKEELYNHLGNMLNLRGDFNAAKLCFLSALLLGGNVPKEVKTLPAVQYAEICAQQGFVALRSVHFTFPLSKNTHEHLIDLLHKLDIFRGRIESIIKKYPEKKEVLQNAKKVPL